VTAVTEILARLRAGERVVEATHIASIRQTIALPRAVTLYLDALTREGLLTRETVDVAGEPRRAWRKKRDVVL
jgi:hypothetical protein